jgi:hypothetical protein
VTTRPLLENPFSQTSKILSADALFLASPWFFVCGADRGLSDRLGRDFGQKGKEFPSGSKAEDGFDRPIETAPVMRFSVDECAVYVEDDEHSGSAEVIG